ncbi:MAG: LamG-like jellyroll fold domain-containing protein [Verrucomicrobiia bacterium]
MNSLLRIAPWSLVALLATATANATVTYIGEDIATNAKWRTSSVTKPNDIDGDNVYGSAGYYLPAGLRKGYKDPFLTGNVITASSNPDQINTVPNWFLSLEYAEPAQTGRSWGGDGGNFGNLDNIGGGHSGFTGAPVLQNGGLQSSPTMELILKRSASPAFRLTLIFGNSTEASAWIVGQTVTVDDGTGPATGTYSDPPFGGAVGFTTYQSWDISPGSSDITIFIDAGTGLPRLGGFAIDTTSVVAPVVSGDPVGGTFLVGATLALSGSAGGTAPTYEWFKDGVSVAGETGATLTIPSLTSGDAGSYYFVARNSAGSATSSVAVVTIATELPDNLVQYQAAVKRETSLISYYDFDFQTAKDSKGTRHGTLRDGAGYAPGVAGGASKTLSINAGRMDLGAAPEFQFVDGTGTIEMWVRPGWYPPTPNSAALALFANADANGANYAVHLNSPRTMFQFRNGFEPLDIPVPDTGTDWHHFAAIFNNGELTVVWDGEVLGSGPFALGGATATTQIGSPDEGEGNERWIGDLDEVAIFSDAVTVAAVQAHYKALKSATPPEIIAQPQGGNYLSGASLTLAVSTRGVDLTYQWFKDGTALAGQTGNTLALASVAAGDGGSYTVKVSNAAGTVESNPALVTVAVTDLAKYQSAVRAEPALVSYYTFDAEDANDTKSSNHGLPVDVVEFGKGVGGSDKALVLTGLGHVALGAVEAFDFADGTGTVEAWLRADYTTPPPYNATIIADRDGGSVNWSLHLMQSKGQIAHWNGSAVALVDIPNAAVTWHHFASTFNGSTWSVYWDGELAGTTDHPFGIAPEAPTQLGSSSEFGSEQWVGAMDEVAFYSDALSAEAVRNHYQAMVGAPPVQPPTISVARSGNSLVLSWPAAATGFVLESSAAIAGGSWAPVSGVVNNSVTVDTSTGSRFYRLRKP